MQPPQTLQGSVKASLLYGLIFGGIISIIDIAYSALLDSAQLSFLTPLSQALSSLGPFVSGLLYSFIVDTPFYLLLLVAFLLAGLFATRKTRKISTGLLAGLWLGLLYLVVDLLVANILLTYLLVFPHFAQFYSLPASTPASEVAYQENLLLTTAISYSIITWLALVCIGLVCSSLGAMISNARAKPIAEYPYPYPPLTYGSQHQYPYNYSQMTPQGWAPPAQAQMPPPHLPSQGQEPPQG